MPSHEQRLSRIEKQLPAQVEGEPTFWIYLPAKDNGSIQPGRTRMGAAEVVIYDPNAEKGPDDAIA